MSKTPIDATFSSEIFRADYPFVIAVRRDLASIQPVRLTYSASGYKAGQVLGLNTVTGLYDKYSAVSGTYSAKAILFEQISGDDMLPSASGGSIARAIFGGYVATDKCTDLSSQAVTQLGATQYTDASGLNITKF